MIRTVFLFSFLVVPLPGFCQELQFQEPLRLGSQINSEAEEISPLLSPDGKTLYYVRALSAANVGGKMGGTDIWQSGRSSSGSAWLSASRAHKSWNNRESNAVIGIRADGKTIYLLNSYSSKSGIAFSTLFGEMWTSPELVPIAGLEKSSFVGFYMDPSFSVLLISMKKEDQDGEEDLYVSTQDSSGVWSEPISLGPTINTDGFEISPFLSADGSKLYFSSNGHGGFGDADIFVTTRLYNSWTVWSKPKNLGKPINSEKFDAYFSTYGDSISFFASNRNTPFADIYQSQLKRKESSLKDSVSRIVRETQQLLAEISGTNNAISADIEYILFETGSTVLSSDARRSADAFVLKYSARGLREMVIASPPSGDATETTTRSQTLINYFVSKNIPREKIKTRVIQVHEGSTAKDLFRLEFRTER